MSCRVGAADRRDRKDGQGDGGKGDNPPPRRVRLPKHGEGPYHSRDGGVPLLTQNS